MTRFKVKKEPEIIYLPCSSELQSYTFVRIALVIVCCTGVGQGKRTWIRLNLATSGKLMLLLLIL